jgi:hypothetical protein
MAKPSATDPATTQRNDRAVPHIMVVDDNRDGARFLVRLLVMADSTPASTTAARTRSTRSPRLGQPW